MTKASKLYEQLLANPGTIISFRDLERLLEAFVGYLIGQRAAIVIMPTQRFRQF